MFECFPKKYSGLKVQLKLFATLFRKGHKQFIGRTCEPPPLSLRIDKGILGQAVGSTQLLVLLHEKEDLNDLQLVIDVHVFDSQE